MNSFLFKTKALITLKQSAADGKSTTCAASSWMPQQQRYLRFNGFVLFFNLNLKFLNTAAPNLIKILKLLPFFSLRLHQYYWCY
jgi:hypothetical protein